MEFMKKNNSITNVNLNLKMKGMEYYKSLLFTKQSDKINSIFGYISVIDFIDKVTMNSVTDKRLFANIIGISTDIMVDVNVEKTHGGYLNRKAVESIMLNRQANNDFHKCFTFHSQLDKIWRNFTINLNSISLMLSNEPYYDKTFQLAIHSSNSLPNDNDFIKINHLTNNIIRYSEIQTRLLGSGFDTNCFDYNLDHNFGNYSMRSDCITSCMTSRLQNFTRQFGHLIPDHLMRKQYFQYRKELNILFFSEYNDKYNLEIIKSEINCSLVCRKDCKFSHFISNYENKGIFTPMASHTQIIHSPLPDILITHLPEITFNSFVCNFGGILGLWLGLSVFAIFSEFRDIVINLFEKRKRIMNLQNLYLNRIVKKEFFKKSRNIMIK